VREIEAVGRGLGCGPLVGEHSPAPSSTTSSRPTTEARSRSSPLWSVKRIRRIVSDGWWSATRTPSATQRDSVSAAGIHVVGALVDDRRDVDGHDVVRRALGQAGSVQGSGRRKAEPSPGRDRWTGVAEGAEGFESRHRVTVPDAGRMPGGWLARSPRARRGRLAAAGYVGNMRTSGRRVAVALGAGGARGYATSERSRCSRSGLTRWWPWPASRWVPWWPGSWRGEQGLHRVVTQSHPARGAAVAGPHADRGGAIRGERVIGKVGEILEGARIEDLVIPYTAVATDLGARREVWFQRGPVITAIRPRCRSPG
jgi:hypothetical protein